LLEKLKNAINPSIFATMKFLFFITGFFLLYLSCLPCGDSKECNVKAPAEFSANDDHQRQTDVLGNPPASTGGFSFGISTYF